MLYEVITYDIGHPPFSHTLEIEGYHHEEFTREKIKKMEFTNYSTKEVLVITSYSIHYTKLYE